MDSYVRNFVRASLLWLGVGVSLGIAMAVWPVPMLQYRPAHMHANLLGFVAMMIFGVAYHIMPRFNGRPLHSPALAELHLVVANAGLLLMVAGFAARVHWPGRGAWILAAGGLLSAVGTLLFITNIWITIRPAATAAMPSPVMTSPERTP
ncbi:MAG TPA: cbb3-type cytochrome c oxidase subunit I [Longimicrobiales bacterium]